MKGSKLTIALLLTAAVALLLSGCGGLSSIADGFGFGDSADPASIMAGDVLGKTVIEKELVSGDYGYSLYEDSTAVIVSYRGKGGKVEIPSEVDGHSVVAIENKAFYDNSSIESLLLPSSVEVIGNYAFMYCDKLASVTFGEGIRSIGTSAFESENKHPDVGLGSLSTLTFLGAPEVIGAKAFWFCDKLAEIVLPEGVKIIGEWAFAKCYGADKIVLPSTLETLENHAFLKCSAAQSVNIPGSCKTVSASAFYRCTSMVSVTIGEGVEALETGAFEECTLLTEVTLPASLKKLGRYAFYNCSALEHVTVQENSLLESVGKYAFAGDALVTFSDPTGLLAK